MQFVKIIHSREILKMQILKKLVRIYVNDLDTAIDFYQGLTKSSVDMRFEMPQNKMELASIGDLLIISGEEQDLAPFKQTKATFWWTPSMISRFFWKITVLLF
jgi:hypothetical protein